MENTTNSYGNFVAELAASLGETDPKVSIRLTEVVGQLGVSACRILLSDALAAHAQGDMRRADGGGRMLGGAFFRLAKKSAEISQLVPRAIKPPAVKASNADQNVRVLLQHIAECASAAAEMITSDANEITDSAKRKIHDIQSLLGNVITRIGPSKKSARRDRKAARPSIIGLANTLYRKAKPRKKAKLVRFSRAKAVVRMKGSRCRRAWDMRGQQVVV